LRQKAQAAQLAGPTGWSLIVSSLAEPVQSAKYGAKPGFARGSGGAAVQPPSASINPMCDVRTAAQHVGGRRSQRSR
jgi:hypothetical protein